jgi:hypothetical protein
MLPARIVSINRYGRRAQSIESARRGYAHSQRRFFVSGLNYLCSMRAVLIPDEMAATLVRIVAENLASWGGVALHELNKARE